MNRKFLKFFTLALFTAFCIGCQNDNVTGGAATLLKGSRYNPENGVYSSSSGTTSNNITVTNNALCK